MLSCYTTASWQALFTLWCKSDRCLCPFGTQENEVTTHVPSIKGKSQAASKGPGHPPLSPETPVFSLVCTLEPLGSFEKKNHQCQVTQPDHIASPDPINAWEWCLAIIMFYKPSRWQRHRVENHCPVTYRCWTSCHWQIPVFFLSLPFLQWLYLTSRRMEGTGMTEWQSSGKWQP